MAADAPQLMLVEDDPTLADITAFRLELLGYGVRQVHSAAEAQTLLQEETPDLIILDLALGDMDGFELTNQIRNDPQTTEIPILAFSSSADLEDVKRAHAAGVSDFLVTPYDPLVLQHKLEQLLELGEKVF
ncbi:MAG: response regulator [Planctomycetes bacterium]|nr:response regulator [Planctomycetota bacterium]